LRQHRGAAISPLVEAARAREPAAARAARRPGGPRMIAVGGATTQRWYTSAPPTEINHQAWGAARATPVRRRPGSVHCGQPG